MSVNHNTGKTFVSNQLEYDQFVELENQIGGVLVSLDPINMDVPINTETFIELKELHRTLFEARREFDSKRFKT